MCSEIQLPLEFKSEAQIMLSSSVIQPLNSSALVRKKNIKEQKWPQREVSSTGRNVDRTLGPENWVPIANLSKDQSVEKFSE